MKKFLYLAMIALTLFAFQSCKEKTFELQYDLTVDGRANGDVDVSFPGGTLDLVGKTELMFNYNNFTPSDLAFYVPLSEAETSKDPDLREAAKLINSALESQFEASAASGTYYLHFYGVVEEKLTSVKVSFDKTLTNEPGVELKE